MAIVLPRRSDISLTDTPRNENYFVPLNSCLKKSTLSEDEGNTRYSRIFSVTATPMTTLTLHFYDNVIPVLRYV